jgi:hypothetical protein
MEQDARAFVRLKEVPVDGLFFKIGCRYENSAYGVDKSVERLWKAEQPVSPDSDDVTETIRRVFQHATKKLTKVSASLAEGVLGQSEDPFALMQCYSRITVLQGARSRDFEYKAPKA